MPESVVLLVNLGFFVLELMRRVRIQSSLVRTRKFNESRHHFCVDNSSDLKDVDYR